MCMKTLQMMIIEHTHGNEMATSCSLLFQSSSSVYTYPIESCTKPLRDSYLDSHGRGYQKLKLKLKYGTFTQGEPFS